MLQTFTEGLKALLGLGLEISDVGALQMALRTVIIYLVTLAIVRVGSTRFLGRSTAFDVIVGIMLGSVMSRAINGSAPFLPTILAGLVLVSLHWLFAILSFRTDWFGSLVKGHPILLIKDGEVQQEGVRREALSSKDLAEALRLQARITEPEHVQLAYRERNGRISVIPKSKEPRVFVVSVEEGVQTVRIELD